jgi:tyrosinase
MVSGTIPLNHGLMKAIHTGNLKSFDDEDVNFYLARNLKYRVTLPDDTTIGNGDVPSLKISIVSVAVKMATSAAELPIWGDMTEHMDVSTG